MSELPNGVDEILQYLARMAMGYGNHLKWNEISKLKSDMMLAPDRWLVITPDQMQQRALELGMRSEDVDAIVELLKKRKDGRRLVPTRSYSDFKWTYTVDTLPD